MVEGGRGGGASMEVKGLSAKETAKSLASYIPVHSPP